MLEKLSILQEYIKMSSYLKKENKNVNMNVDIIDSHFIKTGRLPGEGGVTLSRRSMLLLIHRAWGIRIRVGLFDPSSRLNPRYP